MINKDFINRHKIPLFFLIIVFLRKLINNKLFTGIVLGYILCYGMGNTQIMSSFVNKTDEATNNNNNANVYYVNKDIKLKRAFIDIRKYEGLNYLAVNKSLKHMNRFLRIKSKFRTLENSTQFYSLAKMEQTKAIISLEALLFKSRIRDRKKIIKIIKYIDKVSKKYLHELAQINNNRWNKDDITSNIGPIYVDDLNGYN